MAVKAEVGEDIKGYLARLGRGAREAGRVLQRADTGRKNSALAAIADAVETDRSAILQANARDLDAASRNRLADALLDRLELTEPRVDAMADGLRQISALPDPVGEISDLRFRPSGLQVGRMRVPLGVIGIIYESRPNVTADAAGLCLKSGNAAILRGGSEALHSNIAISRAIRAGLISVDLPAAAVQVLETTDRAAVGEMLRIPEWIDIIVPRGGKGLIERVSRESLIPVIKHLDGNCHVYIDTSADRDKAIRVAVNAKTRRYGVCGAMESLLIAEEIAADVLPELAREFGDRGVELRGCDRSRALVPAMRVASEEDWRTEYLAPVLSVKVVSGVAEAIDHINKYGSHHTDSIVTENLSHGRRFLAEVDSSSVMVNASTQFADGYEYGLGAEIGISTDKLHVRGPVGLEGLTTQKYVVIGDGHVRS